MSDLHPTCPLLIQSGLETLKAELTAVIVAEVEKAKNEILAKMAEMMKDK